jgi:hypothetical protein
MQEPMVQISGYVCGLFRQLNETVVEFKLVAPDSDAKHSLEWQSRKELLIVIHEYGS